MFDKSRELIGMYMVELDEAIMLLDRIKSVVNKLRDDYPNVDDAYRDDLCNRANNAFLNADWLRDGLFQWFYNVNKDEYIEADNEDQ